MLNLNKKTGDTLSAFEVNQIGAAVDKLEKNVEHLQYFKNGQYCVGGWNADSLSPESIETHGDAGFALQWQGVLLDTEDNKDICTTPVGWLKKDNYLRFEDGSFAPTIGITEEMRAKCDIELYLDPQHKQKYCEAGQFNAEQFYNQHGMSPLYNITGQEVRVLRPWETTKTQYTIGVARRDTLYLLDNVQGKSGKIWKGVFAEPTSWDGIDVSKFSLVPTALSPSMVCTINNKTRSFFYLYTGEGSCAGFAGTGGICKMFQNNGTYPRVNDVSQINLMKYARLNNSDTQASYPFAEGGFHAWNTFISSYEVGYGTKYIHSPLLFGSGISSNDSCVDENSWRRNGGIRYKAQSDNTWKYATWGGAGDIYTKPKGEGKMDFFSNFLNSEAPKERCMESQMAVSFARERNIQEGVEFEFYGNTYWYRSVKHTTVTSNPMDVVVYKKMRSSVSAYNANGDVTVFEIEVILRMSLFGGMSLSGDVVAYCGGGYEQVGTCINTISGSTDNPIDCYLEPDQSKWVNESQYSLSNLGQYSFEKQYLKIGTCLNLPNGYCKKRISYSGYKSESGGNIASGECCYVWSLNYWSNEANARVRVGTRLRGFSVYSLCSARCLTASSYVGIAARNFAGLAQAMIKVTDWAPPAASGI